MDSGFILLTLAIGTGFSFIFIDPPNSIHPVSWFGKLVSYFIPKLKNNNPKLEKLNGIIFSFTLVIGISLVSYYASSIIYKLFGILALMIFSILVLKFTMAILTLERHVQAITCNLKEENLDGARKNLSQIVGRQTDTLDSQHILSATIESIGENMVDGIGSVIFYYSLLGPPGAIAFRIINTLDSMIGYRDNYHKNMGWMSAKLDTVSNYLPARICALLLIISSKLVGCDWKYSIMIMRKDHKNTPSINGGYPMSALAGALKVKLEKIGFYELGTNIEPLSIEKCNTALTLVKLSILLFFILISLPMLVSLSYIGWWEFLYGF